MPEKDSVDPFLSTEKDGSRGTFALMTDGSVRYIKKGIPDEIFKAMATIRGPAPANLDLDTWAPTVAAPPKVELPPLDLKEKPLPPTVKNAPPPIQRTADTT